MISEAVQSLQLTSSMQQSGSTAAMHAEVLEAPSMHSRLKRSISDVALAALESVDSLKCPIMEFGQLELKRKIGDGAIGQASLLSKTYATIRAATADCLPDVSVLGGSVGSSC